jgi:hypothetical protein
MRISAGLLIVMEGLTSPIPRERHTDCPGGGEVGLRLGADTLVSLRTSAPKNEALAKRST